MNPTFKKGDKVKVVQQAYGLSMGGIYEVARDSEAHFTYVYKPLGGIDGWKNDRFELVKAANETGTFILIVKTGTKYAPAEVPRTYSSLAQAQAVAHSMAVNNPGSTFVIFKAIGEAFAEKPKSVINLY
jgi:hypothetical protein